MQQEDVSCLPTLPQRPPCYPLGLKMLPNEHTNKHASKSYHTHARTASASASEMAVQRELGARGGEASKREGEHLGSLGRWETPSLLSTVLRLACLYGNV